MVQTAGQGSNVGTFQFYMLNPPNPGRSWLVPTVCPGDTFVFLGTVLYTEPPGPRVMPLLGSYYGPTGATGPRVHGQRREHWKYGCNRTAWVHGERRELRQRR